MIRTKQDLAEYLKKDRFALGITRKRPRMFGDEVWRFEIMLRRHEYYTNCRQTLFVRAMRRIYRFRHHRMGLRLGFDISCNTFGPGLRINHTGYLRVHPNARIGEFCDIHQLVHIGQNREPDSVPTIGNNVWIGPGVKIYGKITIADDIVIGANAVVNKSFLQKNVTIAGVPAKVVKNAGNVYHRSM